MVAMENEERRQVRPVQRRDARDRPHVVPDDRRLERAHAHVAGRRLQHLHQLLLGSAPLSRRRARTPSACATTASRSCSTCSTTSTSRSRSIRIASTRGLLGENAYVKTAVGLGAAARRDPRTRGVRRRVPRVHAPLGVQAPDAGRLLPHHGRRVAASGSTGSSASGSSRTRTSTRRSTPSCTKQVGDVDSVVVLYANHARGVLPIHARFTFTDGSKQDFDYPAEVWSTNTTFYVRQLRVQGQEARRRSSSIRTSGCRIRIARTTCGRASGAPPKP